MTLTSKEELEKLAMAACGRDSGLGCPSKGNWDLLPDFLKKQYYDIARKSQDYIFIRMGNFYSVTLLDDDDAVRNAECNLGTIRVEDIHGRVVWDRDGVPVQ